MASRPFTAGKFECQNINTTLLYSNKQIYNNTWDDGDNTSRDVITQTVEEAYFSREGEYLKEPDWTKVEEANK